MKKVVGFLLVALFFISPVIAVSYSYNEKISITSNENEIGFVKPYQKTIFGVKYSYLQWQRYGLPIGDGFPIALIKGTTVPLPFGIEGEFLKVKINNIGSSSIDLTIDQTSIIQEAEEIGNKINKDIKETQEKIKQDTQETVQQVQENLDKTKQELEKLNSQIEIKVDKAINRGYHSSLHIIDTTNSKLVELSNKIKEKEAELAEEVEDSIVSVVLNSFAVGSGIAYNVFVNAIPDYIRHDITTFLYNIKYKGDYGNEVDLAGDGIATLYLGNPSENKISSQFNEQLKNSNLPYFDGSNIIGKRTYVSEDIGIIAVIPEEKYWDKYTIEKRWNDDRIRLYKTMIAGIGDKGLETAGNWYTSQLELAKDFISGSIKLAGGSIHEESLDIKEVMNLIENSAVENSRASISFLTIVQGWVLTAATGMQNPDFEKVDSLGYVVIVRKNNNDFQIIETWSLQGDKIEVFLGDYEEIVDKAIEQTANDVGMGEVYDSVKKEGSKITSSVIEEDIDENQDDGIITKFFKNIWGWIFG